MGSASSSRRHGLKMLLTPTPQPHRTHLDTRQASGTGSVGLAARGRARLSTPPSSGSQANGREVPGAVRAPSCPQDTPPRLLALSPLWEWLGRPPLQGSLPAPLSALRRSDRKPQAHSTPWSSGASDPPHQGHFCSNGPKHSVVFLFYLLPERPAGASGGTEGDRRGTGSPPHPYPPPPVILAKRFPL